MVSSLKQYNPLHYLCLTSLNSFTTCLTSVRLRLMTLRPPLESSCGGGPSFILFTLPAYITHITSLTSESLGLTHARDTSLVTSDTQLYLHHFTNSHHIPNWHYFPPDTRKTRLNLHEAFEDPLLYLHHFTNSHHILN